MIKLQWARQKLGFLWFGFLFFLIVILFFQNVSGKYGTGSENKIGEVMEWFTSYVMPTISIIATAFISDIIQLSDEKQEISRSQFWMALSLSLLYILLLLYPLIAADSNSRGTIGLLNEQRHFYAIIQGILDSFITFIFVIKRENKA